MGKSYRKPYTSITGHYSAKNDKRIGARGVRRAQNASIRNVDDWDEWLLPDIYECKGNEVYCWDRDGNQSYQAPPMWGDHSHWLSRRHGFTEEEAVKHALESFENAKKYYEKLKRK